MACDVCSGSAREAVCLDDGAVCAVPGVPASANHCRAALRAGAAPLWAVGANTEIVIAGPPGAGPAAAAAAWRSQVAPWWADVVDATITFLGIGEDEFVAGLVEGLEADARAFAELAAAGAGDDGPEVGRPPGGADTVPGPGDPF